MGRFIIIWIFSSVILFAGEVFYGIEMNAKLKDIKTYKLRKPDKRYPNLREYEKILKDDYFDEIIISTDLNNIVYEIRLIKDDIYEAQKVLNKLKIKYGSFICNPDIMPFFGKVGDKYISVKKTKDGTTIKLYTFIFSDISSFSVIYESKYINKIKPISKKEKKLNNL